MTERFPLRVVILGATSAIAGATARIYAQDAKASIFLVARNQQRMDEMAADLLARGASSVHTEVCDLSEPGDVQMLLEDFQRRLGGIDHVLIAYGILGEQSEAERDQYAAEAILRINFISAAMWCLAVANLLEEQASGSLVVFGSVAGDRGRRANFVYGAAKAGLAVVVEGIAHRFASKGPRAVLIKIGPTITPMTAHMNRKGRLWARPEEVARIAYRRAERGGVIAYAPGFCRAIMAIIRNLPNFVFNRMDI